MDDLNPAIFVVPTIALLIVIGCYLYFAKQQKKLGSYNRLILVISVMAFVLNFIWELVQGPLYQTFGYDLKHISFCALASVADMFMVLILFFGFSLYYRNVYWIQGLDAKNTFSLILIGGIGAIVAEAWHTGREDWSYADTMPLLPMVDVGFSPVLQFMVLPWLVFLIGRKFILKKIKS